MTFCVTAIAEYRQHPCLPLCCQSFFVCYDQEFLQSASGTVHLFLFAFVEVMMRSVQCCMFYDQAARMASF